MANIMMFASIRVENILHLVPAYNQVDITKKVITQDSAIAYVNAVWVAFSKGGILFCGVA